MDLRRHCTVDQAVLHFQPRVGPPNHGCDRRLSAGIVPEEDALAVKVYGGASIAKGGEGAERVMQSGRRYGCVKG